MQAKAGRLLGVAMSVADGSALGWCELDEQSADSRDRRVLQQLRIVARIAEVHKSQAADSILPNGEAPTRWGQFLLLEQIGGGAFGDVYLARDTQLDRLVAIKLLRPRDESDRWLVYSMLREARALAQVRQTNVVTVYSAEARDGCVGLSMEFVRGSTVEHLLQAHGPFSALDAALMVQELCRALDAVHAAGLVHGDVKAQNVMREEGGRLVLMDFGSGQRPKDTGGDQQLTGTPLYVAPEVLGGQRVTIRSDIYSVGVLLYHLVTNQYPIEATELSGVREAHARGRTTRLQDARPELPDAFIRVVERACDTDPTRRHESAGALQADLSLAVDQIRGNRESGGEDGSPRGKARVDAAAPRRHPGMWLGSLVLMGLALAGVGFTVGWPGKAASGGALPSIQSIAVLPLTNLSGNPAHAYFVDGMTDELIATLGRVAPIRVTSWTSVVPFRMSTKPLREIGRALGVDAVLEGSVLLLDDVPRAAGSGRRVRITTRLVHAGTDTLVWSQSFDRVLADTLTLQNEIARAVAREVHITLTPLSQRHLTAPAVASAAAQDAYLQGRYHLNQYDRTNLEKSLEFLKQAVAIDPGYARAWSALSRCYVMLELAGALPRSDARSMGLAAATQALELDRTLPDAYGSLADLNFYYDWDWSGAERGYQRALELNPSDTSSRSDYARLLAAEGRLAEALREAQRARELDPLSPYATSTVGMMFYYARRYDEAIGELRRAVQFAPPTAPRYLALGRAYTDNGAFADALPALRRAVDLSHKAPDTVAELARALALSGDRTAALDLIRTIGASENQTLESLTYVYAALGDRDQVLTLLNQAIAERAPRALWAKVDPRLDPVRSDPRFAGILEQLGTP